MLCSIIRYCKYYNDCLHGCRECSGEHKAKSSDTECHTASVQHMVIHSHIQDAKK